MSSHSSIAIKTAAVVLACTTLFRGELVAGGRHEWRGLWVGSASLDHVTRVVSVVGDNNVRNDPNPAEPEPTADRAEIRLIVHVNAAGQVRLLKGVAILDRSPGLLDRKDISLVTDPSLFPGFEDQFARRVASAAFDFGESQAVNLVDEVIEVAASAAAARAVVVGASLDGIRQAVAGALDSLAAAADVNARFVEFLTEDFEDSGNVIAPADFAAVLDAVITTASAEAYTKAPNATDLADLRATVDLALASNPSILDALKVAGKDDWPAGSDDRDGVDNFLGLKGRAVFRDARGVEVVTAAMEAAAAVASRVAFEDNGTVEEIVAAATLAAAEVADAAADLEGTYNNFIASRQFLDLEQFAAEAAVRAVTGLSGDAAERAAALRQGDYALLKAVGPAPSPEDPNPNPNPGRGISDATGTAAVIKATSRLDDDRANVAVRQILEAVVVAVSGPAAAGRPEAEIRDAADVAAAAAMQAVTPGVVSTSTPSRGYNQYLASNEFETALTIAASTAAAKADDLKTGNSEGNIRNEVTLAVSSALRTRQIQAARVARNEIDLEGSFEPGSSVEGTIILPADHVTNPFRHRRHNLNSTGFDIRRIVTLTFQEQGDNETLENSEIRPVGRGIHRVSGVYEEEVFGLHKNLGGNPDQPIGLRTRGTFTLHRVSLVDALNVR